MSFSLGRGSTGPRGKSLRGEDSAIVRRIVLQLNHIVQYLLLKLQSSRFTGMKNCNNLSEILTASKMQITKNLILLAVCAATASAVTVPDTAIADECSNLGGVMSIPDHELPEGVKPSDVRRCIEHPLGRERYLEDASLAPWDDAEIVNTPRLGTQEYR
jgi:hypothetical protein